MLRLYDYAVSGNCYKIRLLLTQLEQGFERIEIDILRGQAKTANFSMKNPLQKLPVLEWPDGRILTESNAILFYLAEGTEYLPEDIWQRAQVLRWQFFEQFSHVPYIGAVRFWHLSGTVEQNRHLLESKMARGYRALRIMEEHLSKSDFFVGNSYSIADITLYAYTHVAHEGGFDLEPHPKVRGWIDRVSNQPRHLGITE
jgi:glutathione S-transferase